MLVSIIIRVVREIIILIISLILLLYQGYTHHYVPEKVVFCFGKCRGNKINEKNCLLGTPKSWNQRVVLLNWWDHSYFQYYNPWVMYSSPCANAEIISSLSERQIQTTQTRTSASPILTYHCAHVTIATDEKMPHNWHLIDLELFSILLPFLQSRTSPVGGWCELCMWVW